MATESSFTWTTTGDEVVTKYADQVKGRTFLLTGPSPGGVGEATVLALAKGHPSTLILVARTPSKLTGLINSIHIIDPKISVRTYTIDLASIASVRAGATQILTDAKEPGAFGHIDVLINSAAVSGIEQLTLTKDGIETTFATNHVGPFLLTNMLVPLLKEGSRVVNISSIVHSYGGDYSDVNFEKTEYSFMQSYTQSKLAGVHLAQSLAKALGPRGVTAMAVHPGVIWGTGLAPTATAEDIARLRAHIAQSGANEKSAQQGASTGLVAALDPAFTASSEYNGKFMSDCQMAPVEGNGKRTELADTLWKMSEQFVGQKFAY